jgi:hypothetical protein
MEIPQNDIVGSSHYSNYIGPAKIQELVSGKSYIFDLKVFVPISGTGSRFYFNGKSNECYIKKDWVKYFIGEQQ